MNKSILILFFCFSQLFSQILINSYVGNSEQFSEMEPTILVNPFNQEEIFSVWIKRGLSDGQITQLEFASSNNGGNSWFTGHVPLPDGHDSSADPSIVFLPDGSINLLFMSSDVYFIKTYNIFPNESDWSEPTFIQSENDDNVDKPWLSGDLSISNCSNDLYGTYSIDLDSFNSRIAVSSSYDYGLNWTHLDTFDITLGEYQFWPTTTVNNEGEVFVFWSEYSNYRTLDSFSGINIQDVNIMYSSKQCDSITFSQPNSISEKFAVPYLHPENFITSGAFPAISFDALSNKFYLAVQTIDTLTADKNISLYWSEDNGDNWFPILIVPLNEPNKHQVLPWISANNGNVFIVYYEYEFIYNETEYEISDDISIFVVGSADGGDNFDLGPYKLNYSNIIGSDGSRKFEYIGLTQNNNNIIYSSWVDFGEIDGTNGTNVVISKLLIDDIYTIENEYLISENSIVQIYPDTKIIIEEFASLTIEKSVQLKIGENTSIEVYGELIINGEEGEEVELTSEAGDYNIIAYEGSKLTFNHVKVENADRIELWNQSDETTFNNCTFDNNSFVLAVEGRPQFNNCTFSNNEAGLVTVSMTYPVAMPTVENCTFENNDLTGMLSGYRSIPILKGNEFRNNDDGLRVSFGSEPYLFTNGADCSGQNNLFEENNIGVRVHNSGLPWLGIYVEGLSAFEGYNRFDGNITKDVYSEDEDYIIYAQKNHWQYDLDNLCDSGSPNVSDNVEAFPTISSDDGGLVHSAIQNELLGDYILAAATYVALVMENPEAGIVRWAIAGLVRTYTKLNRRADLLTLLEQIAQDYPGTIAFKYASTHQITQLIDNGDYDQALDQILLLEGFYPQSELSPKHLFEEWVIAEKTNGLSRSGQSKAQIAEKLITEYPEDDFGITMSFIQGTSPTSSNDENVTTQDVLPTDFGLTSIYPNPFNPITNITYEIPEETYINISIYDLNGRKLEDLVNTTVQAGRFNTTWNAEKYSSGLYIINMTTPNFSTSQKVVLLK